MTELSTPPDIATTTRVSAGGLAKPSELTAASLDASLWRGDAVVMKLRLSCPLRLEILWNGQAQPVQFRRHGNLASKA